MKNLLKPLFSVALLALTIGFANVGSAFADTVTFTPSGGFTGTGATGLTLTQGGLTVTAAFLGPQTGNTTPAPPTPQFFTRDIVNFTTTGFGNIAAGSANFTLTVNQTVPVVGTFTQTATVSGSISSDQSGAVFITFAQPNFSIGGIRYELLNLTQNVAGIANNTLVLDPSSITRLTVRVSGSAIPEPATMILLGTGLAGIAAKVRRRKGSAQAEDSEV